MQEAKLVDTYANCFVKRDRPSSSIKEVEPEDAEKKTLKKENTPKHTIAFSKLAKAKKSREERNV